MEAILDRGLPYISGPQWLYENVLRDKWVLAVAGTHGKTSTSAMLAWILEHAGLAPGFLIGGVPVDFPRFGAPDRQRVLRDRGRRIRHGVLRQALEVRPLPAAHGDPQQSRIRPRRHLSRPSRDRDAVPSSRAHGSRQRPHHRQRRRGERRARAGARLLERSRALRPGGRGRHRAGLDDRRRRLDPAGRRAAGDAHLRRGRPAQPAERARCARRRAPCGRSGRARPGRARRISRRQAAAGIARHRARRHGVRRLRAPSDRHRDHARRPAPQGRRCADPRRPGAALEHDEDGRGQERAAGQPCARPTACSATPPTWAGTSPARWRRSATRSP